MEPYNIIKSHRDLAKVSPVEPQLYRDAMSHFAGAVHIITTDGQAGLRGTTISACCSLSDAPPTMIACLMKQHEGNRSFIDNGRFCINTLSGGHRQLSDIFAGRGGLSQEKRFALADWHILTTGAPVLEGALAAFDCRLTGWHEHDTHYILHGQVVDVTRTHRSEALIYLNRDYHTLSLDETLPSHPEGKG